MHKLRRLLRSLFGYLALAYGLAAIRLTPEIFSSLPFATGSYYHEKLSIRALGVLLIVVQRLLYTIPLALTGIFGMAWWKLKFPGAKARGWCLAASISLLLSSIPLLPATWSMWQGGLNKNVVIICALLIFASSAGGIAGLFAFSKRYYSTAAATSGVAGDGTHKFLDTIALILQIGGTIGLMDLYMRWGSERGLPFTYGLESWIRWIAVIVVVTILHESAHALVGAAAGMKLRAFIIGPFQFRVVEARWTFEFRPSNVLALSGAAGLTPVNPDQSRWNEVGMIAAGPFANLLTGAVAAALAYSSENHAWRPYWEYFAMFATVSLVAGVVNLIPFRPESLYSDGARIVQLFRSGPVPDYYRAVQSVQSTLISQRRPRDYNIDSINSASRHFTSGEAGLLLRLWAAEYYDDVGESSKACNSLAAAEHICQDAPSDISSDLQTSLVIYSAIMRHDPKAAGAWWQKMQTKKPARQNSNYWLAKCAFHWAENDLDSACAAWESGSAWLTGMPNVGVYNYDRDCYARMKEILNSPLAESRVAGIEGPLEVSGTLPAPTAG
jgi:hypothetical protein